MTQQELVRNKIKLSLLGAAITAMLYMRDKATKEELDKCLQDSEEELYSFLSQIEPKAESDLL